MKSKIIKQQEKELVLLYGLKDSVDSEQIYSLLEREHFSYRDITSDQGNQKLGYLAGIEGYKEDDIEQSPLSIPDAQAMILCGMTRQRMDYLFALMRQSKINITLKAVLTEHNKSWRFFSLLSELQREHEIMSLYMPLQALIKNLESKALLSGNKELCAALEKAKKAIEIDDNSEPDIGQMKKAHANLSRFTK